MEQELKNPARRTLHATTGGVIKAVHLDLIRPAIVDLTYRTDQPLTVNLTLTAFTETPQGAHAESATWLVGRDVLGEGLATGEPAGDGDFAMSYDALLNQVTMVFTDGDPHHNPDGIPGTHRLVVDGEPICTLIRHSYLLVPQPQLDVDAFIADVLGPES